MRGDRDRRRAQLSRHGDDRRCGAIGQRHFAHHFRDACRGRQFGTEAAQLSRAILRAVPRRGPAEAQKRDRQAGAFGQGTERAQHRQRGGRAIAGGDDVIAIGRTGGWTDGWLDPGPGDHDRQLGSAEQAHRDAAQERMTNGAGAARVHRDERSALFTRGPEDGVPRFFAMHLLRDEQVALHPRASQCSGEARLPLRGGECGCIIQLDRQVFAQVHKLVQHPHQREGRTRRSCEGGCVR